MDLNNIKRCIISFATKYLLLNLYAEINHNLFAWFFKLDFAKQNKWIVLEELEVTYEVPSYIFHNLWCDPTKIVAIELDGPQTCKLKI